MTRICIVLFLMSAFASAQSGEAQKPAEEQKKGAAEQKASDQKASEQKTQATAPPDAAPAPAKMEGKSSYTISGTQYWDMTVGTGKRAIPGFTIRVHYTGWYKKNKTTWVLFDSSRGRSPLEFDLGHRRVIKGWDEGIAGMRVGGKRQLVIPPEAAYGREGTTKIPGNTTLIFEVELVEVK